ncbi:MAG TPA: replication-relaxation family protein [Solirubrobacteraceae bacterium]
MTEKRARGPGRVVRARRPAISCAALAEIDRRLLAVLCAHRVVRQDQLARLFPEVPERTLRYRTRRLHDLRLAGRSRPYREYGSASNHHWPTRRADCLMRGDPMPRGGERKQPNPIFLAHATALTELYVTLATRAGEAGLTLQEYRREAEAREPFTHMGKESALAPDAMVILVDQDGRKLEAFVEIDLGTMSHARLRQKADLYAAYTASNAWRESHLFLPALLFLTITDIRAGRFLKALAGMLSHGRGRGRRPFVAGGAGVAWAPHRLLNSSCLADLDGHHGLPLIDVLNAARAPYEEALAYRREREEADDAKRQRLRKHPEEMREFLAEHVHALGPYLRGLGELGERTLGLLLRSTGEPASDERAALAAIARDLGEALPDSRPALSPIPAQPSSARWGYSLSATAPSSPSRSRRSRSATATRHRCSALAIGCATESCSTTRPSPGCRAKPNRTPPAASSSTSGPWHTSNGARRPRGSSCAKLGRWADSLAGRRTSTTSSTGKR